MEHVVKVHTNLIEQIIQSRETVTTPGTREVWYGDKKRDRPISYETNKKIKFASAYYVLKSLTPSGVIQQYHKYANEICEYLNCTIPTLYKLIRGCKKAGYLRTSGYDIVLTSYNNFAETFDSLASEYSYLKFNYATQKFHYVMESAFLQLREAERGRVFESKLKQLPELISQLKNVVSPDKKGNYRKAMQALQIQVFKKGHEMKEEIFYLNPFTTCNSKTLKKMFKFKSEQSVAYLKSKLESCKLIVVHEKRIVSETTQRIKKLFIEWDKNAKQTVWVQPDFFEYAPIFQT